MDIRCNLRDDLNVFAEVKMQSKGYKWRKNHKISSFHQYMNLLNREVTPSFTQGSESPDTHNFSEDKGKPLTQIEIGVAVIEIKTVKI